MAEHVQTPDSLRTQIKQGFLQREAQRQEFRGKAREMGARGFMRARISFERAVSGIKMFIQGDTRETKAATTKEIIEKRLEGERIIGLKFASRSVKELGLDDLEQIKQDQARFEELQNKQKLTKKDKKRLRKLEKKSNRISESEQAEKLMLEKRSGNTQKLTREEQKELNRLIRKRALGSDIIVATEADILREASKNGEWINSCDKKLSELKAKKENGEKLTRDEKRRLNRLRKITKNADRSELDTKAQKAKATKEFLASVTESIRKTNKLKDINANRLLIENALSSLSSNSEEIKRLQALGLIDANQKPSSEFLASIILAAEEAGNNEVTVENITQNLNKAAIRSQIELRRFGMQQHLEEMELKWSPFRARVTRNLVTSARRIGNMATFAAISAIAKLSSPAIGFLGTQAAIYLRYQIRRKMITGHEVNLSRVKNIHGKELGAQLNGGEAYKKLLDIARKQGEKSAKHKALVGAVFGELFAGAGFVDQLAVVENAANWLDHTNVVQVLNNIINSAATDVDHTAVGHEIASILGVHPTENMPSQLAVNGDLKSADLSTLVFNHQVSGTHAAILEGRTVYIPEGAKIVENNLVDLKGNVLAEHLKVDQLGKVTGLESTALLTQMQSAPEIANIPNGSSIAEMSINHHDYSFGVPQNIENYATSHGLKVEWVKIGTNKFQLEGVNTNNGESMSFGILSSDSGNLKGIYGDQLHFDFQPTAVEGLDKTGNSWFMIVDGNQSANNLDISNLHSLGDPSKTFGQLIQEKATSESNLNIFFGNRVEQIDGVGIHLNDGQFVSTDFSHLPSGINLPPNVSIPSNSFIIEQGNNWYYGHIDGNKINLYNGTDILHNSKLFTPNSNVLNILKSNEKVIGHSSLNTSATNYPIYAGGHGEVSTASNPIVKAFELSREGYHQVNVFEVGNNLPSSASQATGSATGSASGLPFGINLENPIDALKNPLSAAARGDEVLAGLTGVNGIAEIVRQKTLKPNDNGQVSAVNSTARVIRNMGIPGVANAVRYFGTVDNRSRERAWQRTQGAEFFRGVSTADLKTLYHELSGADMPNRNFLERASIINWSSNGFARRRVADLLRSSEFNLSPELIGMGIYDWGGTGSLKDALNKRAIPIAQLDHKADLFPNGTGGRTTGVGAGGYFGAHPELLDNMALAIPASYPSGTTYNPVARTLVETLNYRAGANAQTTSATLLTDLAAANNDVEVLKALDKAIPAADWTEVLNRGTAGSNWPSAMTNLGMNGLSFNTFISWYNGQNPPPATQLEPKLILEKLRDKGWTAATNTYSKIDQNALNEVLRNEIPIEARAKFLVEKTIDNALVSGGLTPASTIDHIIDGLTNVPGVLKNFLVLNNQQLNGQEFVNTVDYARNYFNTKSGATLPALTDQNKITIAINGVKHFAPPTVLPAGFTAPLHPVEKARWVVEAANPTGANADNVKVSAALRTNDIINRINGSNWPDTAETILDARDALLIPATAGGATLITDADHFNSALNAEMRRLGLPLTNAHDVAREVYNAMPHGTPAEISEALDTALNSTGIEINNGIDYQTSPQGRNIVDAILLSVDELSNIPISAEIMSDAIEKYFTPLDEVRRKQIIDRSLDATSILGGTTSNIIRDVFILTGKEPELIIYASKELNTNTAGKITTWNAIDRFDDFEPILTGPNGLGFTLANNLDLIAAVFISLDKNSASRHGEFEAFDKFATTEEQMVMVAKGLVDASSTDENIRAAAETKRTTLGLTPKQVAEKAQTMAALLGSNDNKIAILASGFKFNDINDPANTAQRDELFELVDTLTTTANPDAFKQIRAEMQIFFDTNPSYRDETVIKHLLYLGSRTFGLSTEADVQKSIKIAIAGIGAKSRAPLQGDLIKWVNEELTTQNGGTMPTIGDTVPNLLNSIT